jgi:hypothetical protein
MDDTEEIVYVFVQASDRLGIFTPVWWEIQHFVRV